MRYIIYSLHFTTLLFQEEVAITPPGNFKSHCSSNSFSTKYYLPPPPPMDSESPHPNFLVGTPFGKIRFLPLHLAKSASFPRRFRPRSLFPILPRPCISALDHLRITPLIHSASTPIHDFRRVSAVSNETYLLSIKSQRYVSNF